MKLLFEYYFHEDYEGDDGYMRPTISFVDCSCSNNDMKSDFNDDDLNFIFFIPNLDTIEKAAKAEKDIIHFLNSNNMSYILIFDDYCRIAKINKKYVEINLNILDGENSYIGKFPTNIFIRILHEWIIFLKSKNMDSKVIEF